MTSSEWDRFFLGMARYVSAASRDPSTKTGAIIVDPQRRVVSVGYNGFARGVEDRPERYADRATKYRMVVHCEVNAILFAGQPLHGCTLYTWPFQSCSPCAAIVIQSGIKRCVAPPLPPELASRWGDDVRLAQEQFAEAGVSLFFLGLEDQQP
jgi:dCMP deaminase